MPTAVIYYRVSDERQVDGTSLESQRGECERYIVRNGWTLDSSWAEEGESAKTANRPVLQNMLKYCHKNRTKIDYVVFPKIDRMARYLLDYLRVKETFAADGIKMVSVGERIDESAAGRFTENIMAAQAQFDNEQRSERCKGGMEAAVKREGRWCWKGPFGYENGKVGGKPNIVPNADADTVTRLFHEVATSGFSPDDVFRSAQARGLELSKTQFYAMLGNPVYAGLIRSFGGEWAGSFMPIVSSETFRAVQRRLKRGIMVATRGYRYDNPDFPLKATLICPCGKLVTGSWTRSGAYPYYRCHRCGEFNMRRDDAHEKFKGFVATYNLTDVEAGALSERIRVHFKSETRVFESDRDQVMRRVARLKELQRGIALKTASGVIPDDIAREQLAELMADEEAAKEELASIDTPICVDYKAVDFGIETLMHIERTWEDLKDDAVLQVNLQSYLFPEGVNGHKKRDFATRRSPLLELKNTLQSPIDSDLVDHAGLVCNFQVRSLMALAGLLRPQAGITLQ